jgi:hypothetical protein
MSDRKTKRKKDVPAEEKKSAGLKGLCTVIFNQLSTYSSLQEWGADLKEKSARSLGLYNSIYRGDGLGMNTHLLHPMLEELGPDVKRDERGAIVSLKDSTGRVRGKPLEKLQVVTYAIMNGFKEIILDTYDEDDVDADVLLMPRSIQFTELAPPLRKDHHEVALELYSYGNKLRVFTSPALIKELVALPYLNTTNIKGVVLALNSLVEKEAFKLNKDSLTSLESVQTLLQECEKPSQAKFYQTLIAALVDDSTIEEKVEAFIKSPSAEFARVLGFKKPYFAPLFERGSGGKVERVPLSSLGDDDKVLMSTLIIDTKYYESIRGDVGSLLVYKMTANIGIKKNKKWVELTTTGAMKAGLFTRYCEAIAASNKGQSTVSVAKTPAKMDEDSEPGVEDLNF